IKLVTEEFFLNNEKHETTRKNFMEAALTASMRRTSHEIFSGHWVQCPKVGRGYPERVQGSGL
ncbi:MAG: hypothetical protein PHY82_11925, partial [Lentisphaeria bacterium]|nr:hypothetical protein [Lentisphaeria bacterium]